MLQYLKINIEGTQLKNMPNCRAVVVWEPTVKIPGN